MPSKPYRPRFTIEIDERQRLALNRLFPHAFMRPFFSKVLDEIIDLVDKGGQKALAAIISGLIMPSELLPSLEAIKKEVEEQDGDPS